MNPPLFLLYFSISLFFSSFAFLKLPSDDSETQKKVSLFFPLLCALPIIFKGVISLFPKVEIYFFPIGLWSLVRNDFWLPFLILFFSLIIHRVQAKDRRILKFLVVFLFLFSIQQTWRLLIPPEACNFNGKILNGVCMQSSPYTCGAAAIVTLLNVFNIPAQEGEVSKLVDIIPRMGATAPQIAFGLDQKLRHSKPDLKVILKTCNFEDLGSLPVPFLACIKYSTFYNHVICVFNIGSSSALVGDPLNGRMNFKLEKLQKAWLGIVICVQPRFNESK